MEVSILERVICPAMSIDDKYRTLYAALMGVFNDVARYAQERLDREALQGLIDYAMYGLGSSAGKRLVRVYKLKPTVEDAIKLLLLLNNESMAYLPKLKQIYGEIDGDKGYLIVRRDPWYDWYFKHLDFNCEEACSQYEFYGLTKELGAEFKIETLASLPRGDDHCRFLVTKVK